MPAPDKMVEAAKSAARQLARQRRDSFVASDQRLKAEAALVEPVTGLICQVSAKDISPSSGPVVAGYWPLGSELDPRPILTGLHKRGIRVALPVSGPRGSALTFRQWQPDDHMVSGRYGISEPSPDQPLLVPDHVLVPLLAFDRQGGRLGYGAGYYDRTLQALRERSGRESVRAIGLAFAVQELDEVPVDVHDQPLDWIVTEAGIMAFGQ